MKRMIIAIIIFVTGFIGGICTFLRWISLSGRMIHDLKLDLIERFEYLLLGYNTIKGPRKRYYYSPYTRRPYSSYRTSYRNYYDDKGFEEDEEDEDESNSNDN